MARQIYTTVSSTAVSRIINLDYNQSPFNVSLAVTGSSSGTFTYTVEYSLDDQQQLTSIGSTRAPVWFSDANLTALSCNATGNYMFPVAGVRITASALSSAVVTLCTLQGGMG